MQSDIKLIIAGSRDLPLKPDLFYTFLSRIMDRWVDKFGRPATVISGRAKGIDTLGERWAVERQILVDPYPAEWKAYGKTAGYLRNQQMAEVATHLLAFWNGVSKGTKHMIDIAQEKGLPTYIVRFDHIQDLLDPKHRYSK